MTRDDLDRWIVAVNNKEELEEVLMLLQIEDNVLLSNFPMIIYQGLNKSIDIREIEQDNLEKLGKEKLETKTLWNFHFIKSGLAEKMTYSKFFIKEED
jgi:hypothetical protein